MTYKLGSSQFQASWAFLSVSAGSGTAYAAGFYEFAGSDSDFSGGVTFGTANNAYAAHLLIVTGAVPGSQTTIRVSGTSIDDEGVRTAADTEDIIIPAATPINTYYETRKWIGQVTITHIAGALVTSNYGWTKYYDQQNSLFTLTSFEVTWQGAGNDASADFVIYHHKSTGWTFNAGAPPTPPTPVARMSTTYVTEREVANNEYGAFKRVGLSTQINGADTEGIIFAAEQSGAKPFGIGTVFVTLTTP